MPEWADDQVWESDWWDDCLCTFGEEAKQITYAHRMGLVVKPHYHWPVYDLGGAKVLDIGGGPTSILLKCHGRGEGCMVIDPLEVPYWVRERYHQAKIDLTQAPAEGMSPEGFDEVWIYNVLQHVQDPEKVAYVARAAAPVVRIFEWIDTPQSEGHPHTLHADELSEWFGGALATEIFSGENDCRGAAAYGVTVRALQEAS